MSFDFPDGTSVADVQTDFLNSIDKYRTVFDSYVSSNNSCYSIKGLDFGTTTMISGNTDGSVSYEKCGSVLLPTSKIIKLQTRSGMSCRNDASESSSAQYYKAYFSVDTTSDQVSTALSEIFDTNLITKTNSYGRVGKFSSWKLEFSKVGETRNEADVNYVYPKEIQFKLNGGQYTESDSDNLSKYNWVFNTEIGCYTKDFYEGTTAEEVARNIYDAFYNVGFSKEADGKYFCLVENTDLLKMYAPDGWTTVGSEKNEYSITIQWSEGVKFSFDLDGGDFNSYDLSTGMKQDANSLYVLWIPVGAKYGDVFYNYILKYENDGFKTTKYSQKKNVSLTYDDTSAISDSTKNVKDEKTGEVYVDTANGIKELNVLAAEAKEKGDWTKVEQWCEKTVVKTETTEQQNKLTIDYQEEYRKVSVNMEGMNVYLKENKDKELLKEAGWIFDDSTIIQSIKKEIRAGTKMSSVCKELQNFNDGKGLSWARQGTGADVYVFNNKTGYICANDRVPYDDGGVIIMMFDYVSTFSGTVTDSKGSSIANAKVTLSYTQNIFFPNTYTTTTNEKGEYKFEETNYGFGASIMSIPNLMSAGSSSLLLKTEDFSIEVDPPTNENENTNYIPVKKKVEDPITRITDFSLQETDKINIKVDCQELLTQISELINQFAPMIGSKTGKSNFAITDYINIFPCVKDYTTVAENLEPRTVDLQQYKETVLNNNPTFQVPEDAYYVFYDKDPDATQREDKYYQTLVIYDSDPFVPESQAKKVLKFFINFDNIVEDYVHIKSELGTMLFYNNKTVLSSNGNTNKVISQGPLSNGDSFVLDYTGQFKYLFLNDVFYNILLSTGNDVDIFNGAMNISLDFGTTYPNKQTVNMLNFSQDINLHTNLINILYLPVISQLLDIEGIEAHKMYLTANEDGTLTGEIRIDINNLTIQLPNKSDPQVYSGSFSISVNVKPVGQTLTNAESNGYNINGFTLSPGQSINLYDYIESKAEILTDTTTLLVTPNQTQTISGLITDRTSGVPLPYAQVSFVAPGGQSSMVAADETGHYKINIPVGGAEGLLTYSYTGHKDDIRAYKPKSVEPVELDVALAREGCVLSGKVVSEGQPVEGATVTFISKDTTETRTVTTSADGSFILPAIDRLHGNIPNEGEMTISKENYTDRQDNITTVILNSEYYEMGEINLAKKDSIVAVGGKVTHYDGEFNNPLEGAIVTITWEGGETQTITTGEDGTYSFDQYPKGCKGSVKLTHPGMQDVITYDITSARAMTSVYVESIMVRQAGTQISVSGKATNQHDFPITNAMIGVKFVDADEEYNLTAFTDSNGEYVMYSRKSQTTEFSAQADGYEASKPQKVDGSLLVNDYVWNVKLNKNEDPVEVTGYVYDDLKPNNPVPNATIEYVDENGYTSSAKTDSTGLYKLSVDNGVGGEMTVSATGYDSKEVALPKEKAKAGEVLDPIVFTVPTVDVTGDVLDDNASPVSDADVSFRDKNGYVYNTTTDDKGQYTLKVHANYGGDVTVTKTGYESGLGTLQDAEAKEGGTVPTITLKETTVSISGQVNDDKYNPNKALAGATIKFTDRTGKEQTTITDTNGQYTLNVKQGVGGKIEALADNHESKTVEVPDEKAQGGTILETITLKMNTVDLNGVVKDDQGKPVEGAKVTWVDDNGYSYVTTTDENGNYVIKAHENVGGKVTVEKEGYQEQSTTVKGEDVKTGGKIPEIDIPVVATYAHPKGTVYDDFSPKHPLANATVKFTDGTNYEYQTTTDTNGGYMLTVREGIAGTISVEANNHESATANLPKEKAYDGKVIDDITLNMFTVDVTGTLVDQDGKPVAGATVTFVDNNGYTYKTTTDDNGNYILKVHKGVGGTVTFEKEGYETQTTTLKDDQAISGGKIPEIVIPVEVPFVHPKGTVYDDLSPKHPLANATVKFTDNTKFEYQTTTDTNGGYTLTVREGIAGSISVEANNHESATANLPKEKAYDGKVIDDITLKMNTVDVTGTLLDENGNPIKDAKVTFVDKNGYTYTTTTDENGNYVIKVHEGYGGTIKFEKEGYQTTTTTLGDDQAKSGGKIEDVKVKKSKDPDPAEPVDPIDILANSLSQTYDLNTLYIILACFVFASASASVVCVRRISKKRK